MANAIVEAIVTYDGSKDNFHVMRRGRPEQGPHEAARIVAARRAFGRKLRMLREGASLTLSETADLIGMTSPRKLAQYETTCYPSGEVLCSLANQYGVSSQEICSLLLSHSDPDAYEAITGNPGYRPSEEQIVEQIHISKQEAHEKAKRAADALKKKRKTK